MATYLVSAKNANGQLLLSVHVDDISQDSNIVQEIDVVNALKSYFMTLPGVTQTSAQKGEWVTTSV